MRIASFWLLLAALSLTATGCIETRKTPQGNQGTNPASNAKGKPIIIGFDEAYETLDAIKAGKVYATVVQDPYQFGYLSIKILAGLAQGDEGVLKESKADEQGRIFVPHRVIQKDNVDDFYAKLKTLKAPGKPAPVGEDRPMVAFVSNNAFDFWTIAENGALAAGKEFNVRAEVRKPARGTSEEQQQIIEDLINKGVKGLSVSINDPQNSVVFYREKVAPKVTLLTSDNDLPDPKVRKAYIGTDNYQAGLAVGKLITEALPGGGKIAIFVGKADALNAVERRQGVLDYLLDPAGKHEAMGKPTPSNAVNVQLGKYTLITTKYDDAKETKCQEMAQDLLIQHPDVGVLVGLWAYNPPALVRAAYGN